MSMNDNPLDQTTRCIIEQLQLNGRKSYAQIAESVNLSGAGVRQRVKKLIDSGYMEIVAVTDPRKFGFS